MGFPLPAPAAHLRSRTDSLPRSLTGGLHCPLLEKKDACMAWKSAHQIKGYNGRLSKESKQGLLYSIYTQLQ